MLCPDDLEELLEMAERGYWSGLIRKHIEEQEERVRELEAEVARLSLSVLVAAVGAA